MIRHCMRSLFAAVIIAAPVQSSAAPPKWADPEVTVTYGKSPFTDFLYYLLYRSIGFNGDYPQLKHVVPLDGIAPIEVNSSFMPQDASLSNVTTYDQLYALAEKHDNPKLLKSMLHKAEPEFPAFMTFWKAHLAPDEDHAIATARKEDRRWHVVAHLERMERLKFPFETLRYDVFALETQGGSMQGPPVIFSTTDVPDLAWAIGHEGTHMMLEKAADFTHRPGGAEAVRLMTQAGGSEYAVEEALCLLIQAKMSIAAGKTKPDFLTSNTIADSNPSKKLLIALEHDWPTYLQDKKLDAANWLIEETIKTYSDGQSRESMRGASNSWLAAWSVRSDRLKYSWERSSAR